MIIDITQQHDKHLEKYLDLKDKRILEIGGGNGLATRIFTKDNNIYAINHNTNYIKHIKHHFPEVNVSKGSADNLKFKNEYFDVVIFPLIFHHIPFDKMKTALSEAHRVLKPNGHVCFFEIGKKGSFIECEKIYYDESHLIKTALENIETSKLFNITENKSFMVDWEFDDFEDFLKHEMSHANPSAQEIECTKKCLEKNIKNGKITIDIETIFLLGEKINFPRFYDTD